MPHRALRYLTISLVLLLCLSASPLFAGEPYVLSVQQLKAGLDKASTPDQKGFLLIDVRTSEEHQGGYIPGTDVNIDFREIGQRYRELEAKTGDHIVVYCQSGHRSNIAAHTLTDLGFTNVYNVEGSMNAWTAQGYQVEQPKGR